MQGGYKGEEIETVLKTVKKLMRSFKKIQYQKFGYTNLQIESMILLLEDKKLNMNDVSEKMDLNRSTATKIMDALLKEGYIVREKDKKDGRVLYVFLTEKGKQLATEFKSQMKDYYRRVIEELGEYDLRRISDSIVNIERVLENGWAEEELKYDENNISYHD